MIGNIVTKLNSLTKKHVRSISQWDAMEALPATSPDITHGIVWWVFHLAAIWQRNHFGSAASQNATSVCLATSPGKYKDFNAESLTQTPAVSPGGQFRYREIYN
jgi:hypothetical protein